MYFLRRIFRKLLSITILPILRYYLSSTVKYKHDGLTLSIAPGVFHPGFFYSTKYFGNFLRKLELHGKSFLDLGTGSGMLAFIADRAGAKVTASDISKTAIENLRKNLQLNRKDFKTVHSDLFDEFPKEKFDLIAINPPYYRQSPKSEADYAWYCGEQLEYFKKLFKQMPQFIFPNSSIFMVLSEDCALEEIKQIAASNGFQYTLVNNKRIWLEMNYIFEFKLREEI